MMLCSKSLGFSMRIVVTESVGVGVVRAAPSRKSTAGR
jgi:hypothetical protein